jgi:hypothetical protein
MSRALTRVLARLASPQAVLAPERDGDGFALYPRGDRRRRPAARLRADEVRRLESEGALASAGEGCFVLSEPGRMRVRREGAEPSERFAAQHAPIVERGIMDADGAPRSVRGFDVAISLRRLAAMRDVGGKAWLSAELAAAASLRGDWEAGQAGLLRGSDWRAPPKGSTPRGGNGADAAMAARCDARRRSEEKLAMLAPPLRRVVERVCLYDDGVEALERAEGWPARSGKLALKLALAQLAAHGG